MAFVTRKLLGTLDLWLYQQAVCAAAGAVSLPAFCLSLINELKLIGPDEDISGFLTWWGFYGLRKCYPQFLELTFSRIQTGAEASASFPGIVSSPKGFHLRKGGGVCVF